ncbi:hypothetical protein KZZ52_03095 [Dactylosporangium sp. AC04546]|uniref:hypothetical protein n=1 Tax=Dactylosporangium sp. AC04546 TaxID=2862460 RepID=UPI001EDE5F38|nr:hypothetical protein [Dactylosporangium sp. AC04546]WVK84439.1 hypothetical protein KZZ52_03095 [Dactylosporangium sp. AC04546]
MTDNWLAQLPADTAQHARRLLDTLSQLGCQDPDGWVRSEVTENIPQAARYRFLHTLWPRMIDAWQTGIDNIPAAQRALQAGADHDDLARLARVVAYETVFGLLYHLDDDDPDELANALPGWRLVETDSDGTPTGRTVEGLYESLLSLDPSGRDGSDFDT